MQANIHPKYVECTVVCGCGSTFKTRSTKERIAVEICSACHPFYTGKEKLLDTAGMVDRFKKKYEKVEGAVAAKKKQEEDARKAKIAEQAKKIDDERKRKDEDRKKKSVERDAWVQRQQEVAAKKQADAEQAAIAEATRADAAASSAAAAATSAPVAAPEGEAPKA
ncbi:MAG: large subunit ribosomal protein [Planctomycetota bacterium]|nr:MAG: large subunit ribosomal protein [Planctomycetota bacterium]